MTTEPTPEELSRVAAYWRRVELLTCRHEEAVRFTGGEPPICDTCEQSVRWISDVQIEDLWHRARRSNDDL